MASYHGVPVYVGGKRVPPQGSTTKDAIRKQGGTAGTPKKGGKR
ncbi:MAG: hypothetical protein QOH97_2714 [Actinoplanes sp.]|jgi:hypothetical protein|nr:hypothetical protein [Actinoplanes sp.]